MTKQNGRLFSLPKGVVPVESFTTPGKIYEVDTIKKTCSCPAFQKNKRRCKHLDSVFKVNTKIEGFSLSLLKSNLQKAIRKSKPEIAVKTAKELMQIDEIQFLRRWLVIILEDGLLHPKFTETVDILKRISSNKYEKLTDEEKDMLINTAREVAECEWRDDWVDEDAGVIDNPEESEAADYVRQNYHLIFKLPEKEMKLAMAIKYRSEIGGMGGDIVMLKHYFNLWAKRFLKQEWSCEKLSGYFKTANLKFNDIKKLKKEDILIEAIDFHCSPVLNIMLKKLGFINLYRQTFYEVKDNHEEFIKGIYWRQRSSINIKKEISSGKTRDWYIKGNGKKFDRAKETEFFKKVEPEIIKISQWYLGKINEEKTKNK